MTAQLSPPPRYRAVDSNGNPIAFGKLTTYAAGTTTPQATYVDSTQTTQNTNPIILNAMGECALWLDPSLTYKFNLTDQFGNQVPGYPVDNIQGGFTPSGIPASLIPIPTNTWTLGNSTHSWAQLYLGANAIPVLDTVSGNIGYIGRTSAETAASVTPTDYFYPPGDLRRYGCDVTGATDNTTQIQNAISAAVASGGVGFIYHPGGTIIHTGQITIPNGLAVVGVSRAASVFKFTGSPSGSPAATRSAWRYTGVAPWSGYANVMFRHVTLWYQNAINFAAVLEISAWGWAYWDIYDIWVKGSASYGIILDGVELCSLHNSLIENTNSTVNYNVWIVNGADRGFTQGTGFSNIISVRENQISGGAGALGLVDDGGNEHIVQGNNFNQHRFPASFAGVTGLKLGGNSFETTLQTGSANVIFNSVSQAGNAVGACTGFDISGNGFFGNLSSGSLLVFFGTQYNISAITKATSAVVTFSTVSSANPFVTGAFIYFAGISGMTQLNGQGGLVTAIGGSSAAWTATIAINSSGFGAYTSGGTGQMMHSGGFVKGNNFGSQLGRGGAIDVTYLANSECSCNTDLGSASMSHYVGPHQDTNGNTLLPPQNGFLPSLGISLSQYGDTRYGSQFGAAVKSTVITVTYSASMTFDLGTGNAFDITANNGTAFTINSPSNASGGSLFVVTVRNTSGGALGAVTWGPSFHLAGAWVSPSTGNNRSILFLTDGSGISHEVARAAADVAN